MIISIRNRNGLSTTFYKKQHHWAKKTAWLAGGNSAGAECVIAPGLSWQYCCESLGAPSGRDVMVPVVIPILDHTGRMLGQVCRDELANDAAEVRWHEHRLETR